MEGPVRLAVLLCFLLLGARGLEKPAEERLIGWQGETYKPKNGELQQDTGPKPWIQTLSWSPRAFVYHNFLSKAEIKHILGLAMPQMKRSTVVGPNNTGVVDNIRTSAGTFLQRNQDAIITTIEERLAVWSQLPASHQEDMQVLRYGPTNKYGAHCDGLGRVMSVLIYLIAPESGGETAFPSSKNWLHEQMGEPTQGDFSDCAKGRVAYKPKPGDALMFYDMKPNYKDADGMSMHTGCPVLEGVKWNAVKWIHGIPFRMSEYKESLLHPPKPLPDPGMCLDLHEMCDTWAKAGECEKNAGYMLGNSNGRGSCRLACKECKECAETDRECIIANREAAGYMNFEPAEFKGALD